MMDIALGWYCIGLIPSRKSAKSVTNGTASRLTRPHQDCHFPDVSMQDPSLNCNVDIHRDTLLEHVKGATIIISVFKKWGSILDISSNISAGVFKELGLHLFSGSVHHFWTPSKSFRSGAAVPRYETLTKLEWASKMFWPEKSCIIQHMELSQQDPAGARADCQEHWSPVKVEEGLQSGEVLIGRHQPFCITWYRSTPMLCLSAQLGNVNTDLGLRKWEPPIFGYGWKDRV